MNMREVSKDEFFTALYADPRDIMPTIVGRYPYKSEMARPEELCADIVWRVGK